MTQKIVRPPTADRQQHDPVDPWLVYHDPLPYDTAADAGLVLDPSTPYATAREFVDRHYTTNGLVTLRWDARGDFVTCAPDGVFIGRVFDLRVQLWQFLDAANQRARRGRLLVAFPATPARVSQVLDALQAYCLALQRPR